MNQYMDYGKAAVEGTTTDSAAFGQMNKLLNDALTGTKDQKGHDVTVIEEDGTVSKWGMSLSQAPVAVNLMTWEALECEIDPFKCGNKPELKQWGDEISSRGAWKKARGFEDQVHAGTCFPCHFDCALCAGPEAHHCTKCKPNFKPAFVPNPDEQQEWISYVFLLRTVHGTCRYHCPDDMYLDNHGTCHYCHSSCTRCTGPSPHDCLECAAATPHRLGWVPSETSVADVFECAASCPKGNATEEVLFQPAAFDCDEPKDITVSQCAQCHASCAICTAPHSNFSCSGCKQNSGLPFLSSAGQCVATCGAGEFGNRSVKVWLDFERTWFETSACQPCSIPCRTCVGTAINCTSCLSSDSKLRNGNCEAPKPKPSAFGSLGTSFTRLASVGELDLGADVSHVAIAEIGVRNASAKNITRKPLQDAVGQKQKITISGATLFAAANADTPFFVGYNGEWSSELFVGDEPRLIRKIIEAMPTIGTVNVESSASADTLTLTVEFTMKGSPRNSGVLPLMQLNVSAFTTAVAGEVSVVREGQPPSGYEFDEQTLSLTLNGDCTFDDLDGGIDFDFQLIRTPPIPPLELNASRFTRELSKLASIGEIEAFVKEETPSAISWVVRFYADGNPPHVGSQPKIKINTSRLELKNHSARRRLSEANSSDTSASAALSSIFSAGVSQIEISTPFDGDDDESVIAIMDSDPTNLTVLEPEDLPFVPVVHVCGNGKRSSREQCDDNNTKGGDGCDALCQIELGWRCLSSVPFGSGLGGLDTCTPTCGDGRRVAWGGEGCDDNNTVNGDGCSATCGVEPGFACTGGTFYHLDTCSTVCGDGYRADLEICDDGNVVSGDGCSETCQIESGYICSDGSPTSTDTCVGCHPTCASCVGAGAMECTSCAASAPLFLSASVQLDGSQIEVGSCLASCTSSGHYAEGGRCVPCHPDCATCTGSGADSCLSCDATSYKPFSYDTTCISSCPEDRNTFVKVTNGNVACVECHTTCKSCQSARSDGCLSCSASADTPYWMGDGTCVSVCPSGRYATADNKCITCGTTCLTCTNGQRCESCRAGQTLSKSGICTGGCPEDQYWQPLSATCALCDGNCARCEMSATNCTTCAPLTVMLPNSTCADQCPSGMFNSKGLCTACDASCSSCVGSVRHSRARARVILELSPQPMGLLSLLPSDPLTHCLVCVFTGDHRLCRVRCRNAT